ncbi:MAG: type II and III secretion system protein family protein [Sphingobium sp.]|jgi:pilus assembly protein CpaC|uniref:type II and III secretion system protein family protein n=1 Tax=Sphingobium sp. TaxID=1912891 RepID=UPI000C4FAD67|nr:type II and III secretion system protein family protein [Sphingobium sp.]MBU0658878.1 type II and III secretion system protein family protein [Alphaproteobacteria bacterium]MBA4753683.1 type II and III secretion system protein family protein [Sphingobium sp.]MBS86871.1 secretion system protein [Sphingobium sp.]MBU0775673.1 type II and III secretion system protein family protein [Alphaproteobacteria bacterium]MBU0868097.1 type II and III secretion system protein family protein [Alphaproteoba
MKSMLQMSGRKVAGPAIALGLAVAMTAVPGTAVNAAPSSAQDNAILMSVGGSRVVNLGAKMSDVVIGNPEVVDVHVRSQNQLYLIAKKAGETTVFATAPNGKVLFSGTVRVGNNLTSIDDMLRLAMPGANIAVNKMNGMVLLTGTIQAPEDAAEAERLTQAFVGKETTVVSRLRMATPLQVMLQVKISEVSKDVGHKIGMNLSALGGVKGSFSGYIGRSSRDFVTRNVTKPTIVPGVLNPDGSFLPPYVSVPGSTEYNFTQPADGSTTLGFVARMLGMDVAGALDLAESSGLATTLAQPNLTALSGETASFLAGGEYPYTVSNGTQGNSIEFKQYGVQLAFTPTVLADGRISLRVRPTVSSLDFTLNASVPALKSRTAETTVELGSGQAFMIAGLLNNETSNGIDKVPGLGNLPILGSLFKSRQFQRSESELVIVVTPYLVKPMNASDVRLPTDGFRNANIGQGLLLQQGNDGISGKQGEMPRRAPGSPAPVTPGPQASAAAPVAKPGKPGKAAPGFSF